MKVVVQKFGGTSVSSREVRLRAMEHIEQALAADRRVVVVISAMGRSGEPYATDTLQGLIHPKDVVPNRDLDLLLSCGETISAVIFGSMLRGRGHDVAVMSGGQAGIVTTGDFGDARILRIDPEPVRKELQLGRVAVVTGFQGVSENGEVTTLGRGGSDTTATALGVALDAEYIDIFTDVDGIMTADPRIVDGASRLRRITYTEMCNLAYQGARVIHPRAVELAMQKNIPIRVRSTLSGDEGTLVTSTAVELESRPAHDRILTGVAHTANLAQIRVHRPEERPNFQVQVFQSMAQNGISVDFFNVTPDEVVFTVPSAVADRAVAILGDLGLASDVSPGVAKIAAVGAGIHGVPGVMARIVEALSADGIEILQSADSNTTIWCLVREEDMVRAVRSIHAKFELHSISNTAIRGF